MASHGRVFRLFAVFVAVLALSLLIGCAGGTGSSSRSVDDLPDPDPGGGGGGGGDAGSGGSGGPTGSSTQTLGGASCSVYVPDSYSPSTPIPLMVALGGKGASASQMITVWQPVATSQKFIIVSSVYSANAENIREDVKALYNVSIKRCYVGGFSQGGIDSGSRAIRTDTGKKWAAIFMLSAPFNQPGTPCFDGAAWKIPIYFSCGTSDSYFYSYVQEHHSIAQSYGHPAELRTPSGGHSTSIHDYTGCWTWISGHSSP